MTSRSPHRSQAADRVAQAPTKRDAIALQLRQLILSGELPRGTRMQQDELAKRFDASITPVREALRELESEGLLESEPHRGVRVASVDIERLKGVYICRRLLEVYASQRATSRMSPRDIERARVMLRDVVAARDEGDVVRSHELNHAFHFFIYEHCEVPGLIEQIELYWRRFPWDMVLTEPNNIYEASHQHEAILEAIEARDVALVGQMVAEHVRSAFDAIAALITGVDSAPDPFELDAE
jgi:DNA-binding GntR family transcriptional regulator